MGVFGPEPADTQYTIEFCPGGVGAGVAGISNPYISQNDAPGPYDGSIPFAPGETSSEPWSSAPSATEEPSQVSTVTYSNSDSETYSGAPEETVVVVTVTSTPTVGFPSSPSGSQSQTWNTASPWTGGQYLKAAATPTRTQTGVRMLEESSIAGGAYAVGESARRRKRRRG